MQTQNSQVTAAQILSLFFILKLARHGNAPKVEGKTDRERALSEKGRAQAESIRQKQEVEIYDFVGASPFTRAQETTEIVTGQKPVILDSLDMSDNPSDPLNVMFGKYGYAPLSTYFDDENGEYLKQYGRNVLREIVARASAVKPASRRARVFIGGHAVCQAAALWAIAEVLVDGGIESGNELMRQALEVNQGEAEVLVVLFSNYSAAVSVLKP